MLVRGTFGQNKSQGKPVSSAFCFEQFSWKTFGELESGKLLDSSGFGEILEAPAESTKSQVVLDAPRICQQM